MFQGSRLDLLLLNGDQRCYIEVKSVMLVQEGVGLFPDAPTTREQRHVRDLANAAQQRWRGVVVFIMQREDAAVFVPNDAADFAFRETLHQAHQVRLRCMLTVAASSLESSYWRISCPCCFIPNRRAPKSES